jgi:pimeloyl-ACP methyl ester carboxylesterase
MSLVATTPEGEALVQELVATAFMPSAEAFQRDDVEEGVRTFVDGVLGAGAYEDLDSEIRANMMQNARELEGATMDKNLFPPFLCEDATNVAVPTLLVHGELSIRILVLIQDMLEQCLPNQERAMIPAASHGLVWENPEAFNEAVLAFLARH